MRNYARWFFGLIVLAAVVALVVNGSELKVFARLLERAEPLWLIGALVLQLSTYVWLSLSWKAILARTSRPLGMRDLLPLSVAKLFADQAAPSAGISGNVLLVQSLGAKRVSQPTAMATLAISIMGDYLAYIVVAIATLLLLWLHHKATALLAASVTAFVCIAFAILGGTFLLISKSHKVPAALRRLKWVDRAAKLLSQAPVELLKDKDLLARVAGCYALIFIADAASLWTILAAVGYPASFSTAFIAYILASIAATLGPIPMGLGSFEAVSIGMMRVLGVPVEAAAAATLIFRGLSLWLPLAPGLVLARRLTAAGQPSTGQVPPT